MDWYSIASIMKHIRAGDIDPKSDKCLEEAIIRSNPELFDFFLTFEPNIRKFNEIGDTLLHIAVKHGNSSMFRKILKLGFDVNTKNNEGMTPIMIASKIASVPCVRDLLDLGADATIKTGNLNVFTLGYTPAVYRIFYEIGMDIESYTPRPLHYLCNLLICCKEQEPMVLDWIQRLIDRYDINERDEMGETPLHKTIIHRDNRRITEFLINRGADPNIQNIDGKTPLMKALETDLDMRFWTIHLTERMRVIEPLMRGLDLSIKDSHGNGYMFYMVKNRNILDIFDRIVKAYLCNTRLDWSATNNEGKTILDLVSSHEKARRAVKRQIKLMGMVSTGN